MKRALVLGLMVGFGLTFVGIGAALSGEWDTEITIDPQGAWLGALTLASDITVTYAIGDWSFASTTSLTGLGWVDQRFTAAADLGALLLACELKLDPGAPGGFIRWRPTGNLSLAGVEFIFAFTLSDQDTELALGCAGVAGDMEIWMEAIFGDDDDDICNLDWSSAALGLAFPFCCADVNALVELDCSGFVSAHFIAEGITTPNLPWFGFDAEVVLDLVEGKTVSLTPGFAFGDIVCFDLDIDVAYVGGEMTALSLDSFLITGIGLTCDIGAVSLSSTTDFLALPDGYFEVYTISTNDDGCCGPFAFDLTFSFLEGGVALFDLALIEANMEIQIASQFTFNMGLEVDVDTGLFTQWVVGFNVTW